MFTAQVVPAHLGRSIKHNTVFEFFMVVGFIFIPILINYLCRKYISITVWFERSGNNWDCHRNTISGSHHLKYLVYGINRSSDRSEGAVTVMLISSLSPLLPGEGVKITQYRKECVWRRKNWWAEGVALILLCEWWQLDCSAVTYSSAQSGMLWRSKSMDCRRWDITWYQGWNRSNLVLPLVC